MLKYNAATWFWSGPLGIYSSASGSLVSTSDASYTVWLGTADAPTGNLPTPWPKDLSGNQTPEALDEVLIVAGLPATGLASLTKEQLLDHGEAVQAIVFAKGSVFNVGTIATPVNILCDGTEKTSGRLALLLAWGQANPTATDAWKDNNRVFTELTGAQFVTLATLAGAWIKNIYAFEGDIETEINAGTITTTAQIDALVWPTS